MSYAHAAQLALLAAVLAGPAHDQTTAYSSWPTYEGFAGFSASGIIYGPHFKTATVSDIASLATNRGPDGFNVSIARYFDRQVGLKADFSTYFMRNDGHGTFNSNSQPFTLRSHAYNLLFGPEFKLRNHSRATPFVYALAGIAHATTESRPIAQRSPSRTNIPALAPPSR
jgi:hypothetical protein